MVNGKQFSKGCEYHYFSGGGIATAVCYENNTSFGHARAFNKNGAVIYEKNIRKVAGHANVLFSYYPDGAVKRAEWHDAPDGGIQWYSSVTTFSEDGRVTEVRESNYDDRPGVTTQRTPGVLVKPKKEVVKCAVIYASEFWFINNAGYLVVVHADRAYSKDESYTIRLRPGDTAKGGSLVLAQQFDNPQKYYQFSAVPANEHKRRIPHISFLKDVADGNTAERRRYYFVVKP